MRNHCFNVSFDERLLQSNSNIAYIMFIRFYSTNKDITESPLLIRLNVSASKLAQLN